MPDTEGPWKSCYFQESLHDPGRDRATADLGPLDSKPIPKLMRRPEMVDLQMHSGSFNVRRGFPARLYLGSAKPDPLPSWPEPPEAGGGATV